MPHTSRRVVLPRDAGVPVRRTTQRERQLIDRIHDLAVPARCPVCRHILVARLRRGGPYFACGCAAASLDPLPAIAEDGETTACSLNHECFDAREPACSPLPSGERGRG